MKIYRVLSSEEYESFQEKQSLTFKSEGVWARPERFLNTSRAYDQSGKFFFFHLDDAAFFCFAFGGYETEDNILELDVDPKEIFPYLAMGTYRYLDESVDEKQASDHYYPELYLKSSFVSRKLKKGEYRIIPYDYRKRLRMPKRNSDREPNYVALGEELQKLALLREKIKQEIKDEIDRRRKEDKVNDLSREFRSRLRSYGSLELTKEEMEYVKEKFKDYVKQHEDQVDEVRRAYRNFFLEHEKYMMLTPVESEDNAK